MTSASRTGTSFSEDLVPILRCPACRGTLTREGEAFRCGSCAGRYPLTRGGIPVLIDPARSVFSVDAFLREEPTFFPPQGRLTRLLKRFVPTIANEGRTRGNYEELQRRLLAHAPRARVLVIGGSILGWGMSALQSPQIELVETDIALGPRTQFVCDAHSLPFADGSFDGVVAQAVLEHVLDPFQCVDEIHRVLRPSGLVYAETPFMQQVHGGAYDFHRFSYTAYRRLFRRFEVQRDGVIAGPAIAFAWAWEYLLLSFVRGGAMRNLVKAFARITSLPLRYLDLLLMDRPASYDGASGFYILAARSENVVDDRALIAAYRGGAPS